MLEKELGIKEIQGLFNQLQTLGMLKCLHERHEIPSTTGEVKVIKSFSLHHVNFPGISFGIYPVLECGDDPNKELDAMCNCGYNRIRIEAVKDESRTEFLIHQLGHFQILNFIPDERNDYKMEYCEVSPPPDYVKGLFWFYVMIIKEFFK